MNRWLSGLAALCVASCEMTQPLTDHVPADAAVYAGWRGTLEPEAGYSGSRWEAIAKESAIGDFINDTLPKIGLTIANRNPQQGDMALFSAFIAQALVRHTSAIYASFPANAKPPWRAVSGRG